MEDDQSLDQGILGTQQGGLIITTEAQEYLKSAGNWAKFLAILGIVFSSLMIFGGVIVGIVFSAMGMMGNKIPETPGMPFSMSSFGWVFGLIYTALGLVYLFPSIYFLRFANKAVSSVKNQQVIELTASIYNLKRTFKFFGVMTITIIVLYFVIIAAFMAYTMNHPNTFQPHY